MQNKRRNYIIIHNVFPMHEIEFFSHETFSKEDKLITVRSFVVHNFISLFTNIARLALLHRRSELSLITSAPLFVLEGYNSDHPTLQFGNGY